MTRTLTRDQRKIQDALAELRAARIIADRNPSIGNLNAVTAFQEALDMAMEQSQRNN